MTPDYTSRDGRVMLYRQDCVPLMKQFQQAGECFDALICDPPYGIGEDSRKVASRGKKFGGKANEKAHALAYAVKIIEQHSDGGPAMSDALAVLKRYAQSAHDKASLGGYATSRKMTKKQKTERARKAAIARWSAKK